MRTHYYILGQGGIGSHLAEVLTRLGQEVTTVSGHNRCEHSGQHMTIDISQSESVAKLNKLFYKTPPSHIINTVGMLHDHKHEPEKTIKTVSRKWFQRSIDVNTLPTLYLAQALMPTLSRQSQTKILTISARVGSITDNAFGGWTSYRASKAALNMLVKNIAIEWQRSFPCVAIAAYHPGTVNTALSEPFQKNVPEGKLFTPEYAVECLLKQLNKLTSQQSGQLIAWDGEVIAY